MDQTPVSTLHFFQETNLIGVQFEFDIGTSNDGRTQAAWFYGSPGERFSKGNSELRLLQEAMNCCAFSSNFNVEPLMVQSKAKNLVMDQSPGFGVAAPGGGIWVSIWVGVKMVTGCHKNISPEFRLVKLDEIGGAQKLRHKGPKKSGWGTLFLNLIVYRFKMFKVYRWYTMVDDRV